MSPARSDVIQNFAELYRRLVLTLSINNPDEARLMVEAIRIASDEITAELNERSHKKQTS